MNNARTNRTISRTGLDLGFAYLPSGKGVRRMAKLIRSHNRLTSGLNSSDIHDLCRKGMTIRAEVKAMTEFCSAR